MILSYWVGEGRLEWQATLRRGQVWDGLRTFFSGYSIGVYRKWLCSLAWVDAGHGTVLFNKHSIKMQAL